MFLIRHQSVHTGGATMSGIDEVTDESDHVIRLIRPESNDFRRPLPNISVLRQWLLIRRKMAAPFLPAVTSPGRWFIISSTLFWFL